MHNRTEPGSGPYMLLSFVFHLQGRCSLSCLDSCSLQCPGGLLGNCWVAARAALPQGLLVAGWLAWLCGLISFLPIRCDGGKLFILAPQCIFAPFFDVTPQVLLCPLILTSCFTSWWFTWCQALGSPFSSFLFFYQSVVPCSAEDSSECRLLERIKWQVTSSSAGIGAHLELRLAVVPMLSGSIVGHHQTL